MPASALAPVALNRQLEDLRPHLYRVALRYTAHPEAAEDLVQEALVRAYPHLPQIATTQVPGYLQRAVVSAALDRWRQKSRGPSVESLEERAESNPLDVPPDPDPNPEEQLLQRERRGLICDWVGSGMERLRCRKPPVAEALHRQYYEELAAADAAERQRRKRGHQWFRERAALGVPWEE